MPSAGDSNNLRPNLRTLAQLKTKLGAKLSYDKNRGRFSIQEAGIRQSLTRTFSSDSVKSEEYFEKPIRELFAAAHAERADRDDDDDFTDALAGLKSLRKSYRGERDKLEVLDAVIEDAELGMRKDPADIVQLRARYQRYLKFGIWQGMFLPVSNPGVCYSFAVHWARRIILGKTYFTDRSRGVSEDPTITLDAGQKARMKDKVDRKIAPLQEGIRGYTKNRGTAVMTLGRAEEFSPGAMRAARDRSPSMIFQRVKQSGPISSCWLRSLTFGAARVYTIWVVIKNLSPFPRFDAKR